MEAKTLVEKLARATSPEEADEVLSPHRGLDGLSSAFFQAVAQLLGSDPARAFELSRHWHIVKRHGDQSAYAYRAKAAGERARGQWLRSARSFLQAGRAAKAPADRLSFQRAAIDSLARANRFEEAVGLGKRLVRGLDRLGEEAAAAQTRLNLGNALLWQDKYRAAIQQYEKAIHPLDASGLAVDAASAKLGLSTSHLLGGDLKLAERYAVEARDELNELGLQHYADLATINVAQKALLTGRADRALDLLLELRPRMDEASATEQARVNEFIGDAYQRLNLWQEAADSYEAALEVQGEVPLLNRGNCHFGIGVALLSIGKVSEAQTRFRKARGIYERSKNAVWTGVACSHLGRAHLAAGSKSRAVQLCREADSVLSGTHAWFRLAECRLDLAEALLAAGEDATPVLNSASRLVTKHGLAAHAWRPHALRAVTATGDKRLQHYRRMMDRLLEARLLTSSTQSRVNFLADKAPHVKQYLHELFSNPTKRRVREAQNVILRTRSVALLEEILSTSRTSAEAAGKLEELREELNALEAAETTSGGSRLVSASTGRASTLQRRWIEATRSVQAIVELSLDTIERDAVVLIEANNGLYVLSNETVEQLPISAAELNDELRWLEFDLLAPIADGFGSANITSTLERLADRLVRPWYRGQADVLLSPDGALWRVPWQACLRTLQPDAEVLVALHPSASMASSGVQLPKKPRVAIWLYQGNDLPHARREAESFLTMFPTAEVHTSLRELRSGLDCRYDLLHVAGHAKLNPENPMFSYLQFSDGRLHAAEIATSHLRADIVTLSACETARMSLSVQDEPEGLARAFLARGASAVLGSSWVLDDEAAAKMMEPYYRDLASGKPIVEALRTARSAGRAWRDHPYYWASLVLFAGYRPAKDPQSAKPRTA